MFSGGERRSQSTARPLAEIGHTDMCNRGRPSNARNGTESEGVRWARRYRQRRDFTAEIRTVAKNGALGHKDRVGQRLLEFVPNETLSLR